MKLSSEMKMKKPLVGAGTFCSSLMLVFYIPPCRNLALRQEHRGISIHRTGIFLYFVHSSNVTVA
jgi:hypothetical protein